MFRTKKNNITLIILFYTLSLVVSGMAAGLQHTTILRKWLLSEGFKIVYDSRLNLPDPCVDITAQNLRLFAQKTRKETFTYQDIIPCHDEHFRALFSNTRGNTSAILASNYNTCS